MKRKFIALLLSAAMVFSATPAVINAADTATDTAAQETTTDTPTDTAADGTVTADNGTSLQATLPSAVPTMPGISS